jgi:5S rRNA maturation endonuclease (ribonuclease M5)
MNYNDLYSKHVKKIKGKDLQFTGLCPFHDDNNPSFSFNTDSGASICHAGCGQWSAFEFAQMVGEDPTPYSVRNHLTQPSSHLNSNNSKRSKKMKNPKLNKDDCDRAKSYHQYLLDNFDTLTDTLPWKRNAVEVTQTGYDVKTGRFTFVHTDALGNAVNIKHHKSNKGEPPYSISGHGHCRLYPFHFMNKYDKSKILLICEGEKDFVTLKSHGFQAITFTTGAGNFPNIDYFKDFKKIIIIYDNDQGGLLGAKILRKHLLLISVTKDVHIHEWDDTRSKGYDVTDYFAEGGTRDSLEKLISSEPPKYDSQFSGAKLDVKRLTPNVRLYINHARDTTDAPDEFILISFLLHWAGVVGNKIVDMNDTRPNIWCVLFGKSSEIRKTTAIKIGGESFKNIQSKFDCGFDEAMAKYEEDFRIWKKMPAEDKNEIPAPKKPICTNLILSPDFSEAGFYIMLKDNPVAGTIVTGEFSDFLVKIKRDYSNMSNAFLESYDGNTMTHITRAYGKETITNPAFSILAATTIKNFKKSFSATETENGFLQRIFPVVLLEPNKERKLLLDRKKMDQGILTDFENLSMNWIRYEGEIRAIMPIEVKEYFCQWETKFSSCSKKVYDVDIMPHVDRMIPGCLKLAILLESLECDSIPKELIISRATIDCAIMIVEDIFFPSMIYLLQEELIFDKNHYNEKKIKRTVISKGGAISRSELMISTRLSKIELDRLIETMVEKEMIEIDLCHANRPQGGGNSKTFYSWIGK